MNQFFALSITGQNAILTESESQHLRVLRIKEGDELFIVNGQGHQYKGLLSKMHKKAALISQLEMTQESLTRPQIDIAIAPTKSNDRFEWFLEKATELGVRNIYPFTSYHSERKVIKIERMQKIILSAMKQSLRLWLPHLHGLQTLKGFLNEINPDISQKYIAHLNTNKLHFRDVADPSKQTLILIGPEGGFSDEEIESAESAGFTSVTLGPHRYRTETAGILASALFANN